MSKNEIAFFQIPKRLFSEDYEGLSVDAKLLYGVLLERHFLSAKNGWLSEDGNPYFFYPIRELAEYLNISKQKVSSMLKELDDYFLIQRKKQGQGKADVIMLFYFEDARSLVKRIKNEDTPIKKNMPECVKLSPQASQIREILKRCF